SEVKQLKPEGGAVVVMVEVFMPAVRDRINNKVIKKTLTIPAWLNREAEAANVNFSQILQDALRCYLGESAKQ
ncbi:MAG: type II toxin-antitoxin system HicB family antitoxin, partial [Evtepia sp.]